MLYWAAENGGLSAARVLSRIPEVRPHDDWINYRLAVLATPKQQAAGTWFHGTWFHALDGLGRRQAGKHISLVLKALQGDDPVASAVAARALGRLGYREAVPEIRKKLVSLEEPFGPSAVAALVELGGRQEAYRLTREFEQWSFRASVAVLEALHRGDGEYARASIRVVQGISEQSDRLRAIRFLAERDSPAFNQLSLDDVDPYWVNSLHPTWPDPGTEGRGTSHFRPPATPAGLLWLHCWFLRKRHWTKRRKRFGHWLKLGRMRFA